jgi:hypothetical protein
MSTYHLYRWSVVGSTNDPFKAPEQIKVSLLGFRDQEEKKVRTSDIKEVNGREITTATGSVYILEDIDPEYRRWMEGEGLAYDPENPIKMKVLK